MTRKPFFAALLLPLYREGEVLDSSPLSLTPLSLSLLSPPAASHPFHSSPSALHRVLLSPLSLKFKPRLTGEHFKDILFGLFPVYKSWRFVSNRGRNYDEIDLFPARKFCGTAATLVV